MWAVCNSKPECMCLLALFDQTVPGTMEPQEVTARHIIQGWESRSALVENWFQIVRSLGIVCLQAYQLFLLMPTCYSETELLKRSHGREEETVQSVASFYKQT